MAPPEGRAGRVAMVDIVVVVAAAGRRRRGVVKGPERGRSWRFVSKGLR